MNKAMLSAILSLSSLIASQASASAQTQGSTLMNASPQTTAQDKSVVLAQSQIWSGTGVGVQHFSSYVNLAPGQDKLKLNLHFYNGGSGKPQFNKLRISCPNMQYLTEKDFAGKPEYNCDLTGDVSWGPNQILISAEGPKNATIRWTITAHKPVVTSAFPEEVIGGQTMLLRGENLPKDPGSFNVTFNHLAADILSVNGTQLKLVVPIKAQVGANSIRVMAANMDAGSVPVTVRETPVITGLSSDTITAGQTITIYGRGFSSNMAEDQVMLGPYPAQVINATTESITIRGSNSFGWGYFANYPDWFLPLTLMVDGTKAINRVSVNIQITSVQ